MGGTLGLGAASALGFGLEGCGGGSSTEWLVGAYLSLSGAEAAFGQDTQKGIDLAIEEINAQGGLLGRRVQAFERDGKSQVTANSAYTQGADELHGPRDAELLDVEIEVAHLRADAEIAADFQQHSRDAGSGCGEGAGAFNDETLGDGVERQRSVG